MSAHLSIDLPTLERNAERLVAAAMRAGADACDCTVSNGHSLGVSVRDGKVENTGSAEGDGFSLRVFVGERVATVATNQIAEIDAVAERAVAMAKVSPEDPFQGLAAFEETASEIPDLDLVDEEAFETAHFTQQALAAEDAGLSVHGVSKSMGASAGRSLSGFVLATSNGFAKSYMRSGYSVSTAMVAGEGEGMERDYDFASAIHAGDLRPPAEIGRIAGERAVKRLNPRKVDSGVFPVIFDRRIASGLLSALLGSINGAAIARKSSFLGDAMGEKIASADITIVDDPLRKRGAGSRPFDGEGRPTAPLTLVERGVLQNWLLDGATARELNLQPNARAGRGGGGTSPTSTNAWIEAGEHSLEELAREIGTGFYCTETIGHGFKMVTGDYSKGASGYWIENGEIAYPVAEITIAGNLKDMFLSMTPANDLEFRGATNAPSLLIGSMTIGGK